MAWPVDQSGWNQDCIYYGYHSSPTDGVHPWACHPPGCLSCRATSASVPSPRVAVTGPNPTTHQPPVEGCIHKEQKSRPQNKKKNTRQTQDHLPAAPLQCKWEGCRYLGYFNREHELIRHLRNIHIAPQTHSCPVGDCAKVCNRGDNLLQHMKNRHGLG